VRQGRQTKKAECGAAWTEGGTSNAEGRVIGEAQGLNKSKEGLQRLNYGPFTATPHCNIRRDFIDTKHGIGSRPIIDY
jgi:hypothetical protein